MRRARRFVAGLFIGGALALSACTDDVVQGEEEGIVEDENGEGEGDD